MYGGKIISEKGTVWISPDVTPLNLVKRVDLTITTGTFGQIIKTEIPNNRPIVFFTRVFSDKIGVAAVPLNSNGQWSLEIRAARNAKGTTESVKIRFYIFSNFVPKDVSSDWGIQYFNAKGELTWTGDMIPLEVYSGVAPNDSNYKVDVGFTCAVAPYFSASYTAGFIPSKPPVYIWITNAWKAYGNVISSYIVDNINSSSSGYDQFYSNNYYYIKASNYDY
ncbi:hypothetical protein [Arsenophonus apicola]|uniref:hypothetical protein n=1 Tax=Arsenophonus apicola TaxID=2879119 RepID=UPI001CDD6421|nr:hypothetical protein [Arsenophonus apicola]UBX30823.1 hypothetical protein LDL57_16840 [Arsenophonus apicola]